MKKPIIRNNSRAGKLFRYKNTTDGIVLGEYTDDEDIDRLWVMYIGVNAWSSPVISLIKSENQYVIEWFQ